MSKRYKPEASLVNPVIQEIARLLSAAILRFVALPAPIKKV